MLGGYGDTSEGNIVIVQDDEVTAVMVTESKRMVKSLEPNAASEK